MSRMKLSATSIPSHTVETTVAWTQMVSPEAVTARNSYREGTSSPRIRRT